MSVEYVSFDKLPKKLDKILSDWSDKVHMACVETADEAIKDSKKYIKDDLTNKFINKGYSQIGYRKHFSARKKSDTKRILWNTQYQMSHLIENGHYVYNQYGGPYNIHPYRIKKGKWVYGSQYGTSGDHTKNFDAWEDTEKHTAKFVKDRLLKKLK